MPRITQVYDIAGPVPFFDAEVTTDNRWFVDPYAVRIARGPDPFVTDANACTSSFFDTLAGRIAAPPGSGAHTDGLLMLQRFAEPRETRLGMARRGFDGHGGATKIGFDIWTALTTEVEALIEVAVLGQIEHIPLFVHGVDRDITSDLTTRIIYRPLAEFTMAMVEQYPEFRTAGREVRRVERQVWDPARSTWTMQAMELPIVDGKPLLLVPKDWVRQHLLMSAGRFYDTTVLTHAQLQRAVRLHDKVLKTPKSDLKRIPELGRGRGTILRMTHEASHEGVNLVAEFTRFVNRQLN